MNKLVQDLIRPFAAVLFTTGWCLAEPPPERNWTLTFEDNFDSINLANWNVQDQIERKGDIQRREYGDHDSRPRQ